MGTILIIKIVILISVYYLSLDRFVYESVLFINCFYYRYFIAVLSFIPVSSTFISVKSLHTQFPIVKQMQNWFSRKSYPNVLSYYPYSLY